MMAPIFKTHVKTKALAQLHDPVARLVLANQKPQDAQETC